MIYADEFYKYKAENELMTLLYPKINWFERLLLRIEGYKVSKLPTCPEKENTK